MKLKSAGGEPVPGTEAFLLRRDAGFFEIGSEFEILFEDLFQHRVFLLLFVISLALALEGDDRSNLAGLFQLTHDGSHGNRIDGRSVGDVGIAVATGAAENTGAAGAAAAANGTAMGPFTSSLKFRAGFEPNQRKRTTERIITSTINAPNRPANSRPFKSLTNCVLAFDSDFNS